MEERTQTITFHPSRRKRGRTPLLWNPITDTFSSIPSKQFRIGKSQECEIVIPHFGVSRVHLKGQLYNSTLSLTDQGSHNGSFFRGERVKRFQVEMGEHFSLGGYPLFLVGERWDTPTSPPLVTRDPALLSLLHDIQQMAHHDISLLINGETGTGKELAAALVHRASPQHQGPFITLNCGAIPENLVESEFFGHVRGAFSGAARSRKGVFHQAHNGTLFLDEIGELRLDQQTSLLRFLETGEYRQVGSDSLHHAKVRVVAATHKDLEQEVRHGCFRQDLLYRISQIHFTLPPLRNRPFDLPLLLKHFGAPPCPPQILGMLFRYHFPGNIRELKSLAQVAKGFGWRKTREHHLSLWRNCTITEKKNVINDTTEKLFRQALYNNGENVSAAARSLGIPRTTFLNRLRRMGLR